VAQFKRELERELNRGGGVRVPVEAETTGASAGAAVVHHYSGPTVISNGDSAQIAFGANSVQIQQATEPVTPGFEGLAEAVAAAMEAIAALPLSSEDQEDVNAAGTELLAEVTKPEPDASLIRRGLTLLKGALAPIAAGISTGVSAAVSAESQQTARHALELLQSAL
jgi:hypothetical protein